MNKEFDLNKFKKQAAKVSDFLKQKGTPVPKATLFNALSVFVEEKNWNTLRALLSPHIHDETIKNKEQNNELANRLYNAIFSDFFQSENAKQVKNLYDREFSSHYIDESDFILNDNHRNFEKSVYIKANKEDMIGDEYVFQISLDFLKEKIEDEERQLIKNILLGLFFSNNIENNPVKSNIIGKPLIETRRSAKRDLLTISFAIDEISLNSDFVDKIGESIVMGYASSSNQKKQEKNSEQEANSNRKNSFDYFKEKGLLINLSVYK